MTATLDPKEFQEQTAAIGILKNADTLDRHHGPAGPFWKAETWPRQFSDTTVQALLCRKIATVTESRHGGATKITLA